MNSENLVTRPVYSGDDPYELGAISGNAHALILDIDLNDTASLMPYAERVFQSFDLPKNLMPDFMQGYYYGYKYGAAKKL